MRTQRAVDELLLRHFRDGFGRLRYPGGIVAQTDLKNRYLTPFTFDTETAAYYPNEVTYAAHMRAMG